MVLVTTVYLKFVGHAGQVRRNKKSPAFRAPVKFNQMLGEEVEMSGEPQKKFVYTDCSFNFSTQHTHRNVLVRSHESCP